MARCKNIFFFFLNSFVNLEIQLRIYTTSYGNLKITIVFVLQMTNFIAIIWILLRSFYYFDIAS